MKISKLPEMNDDFDAWANKGDVSLANIREDPLEVLRSIDRLLAAYGLEVVHYESGSTDYWFGVQEKWRG
jgi:hypothetical protein